MADRAAWDRSASRTSTRSRSNAMGHARPVAPDRRPSDLRRLATATLSSVVPGLGQLANQRRRPALLFVVPIAILVGLLGLVFLTTPPGIVVARAIEPRALQGLLALNLLVLVWRLAALAHAFLDRGHPQRTGRIGLVGLVVLVLFTAAPHAVANGWGRAAEAAFARIFATSAGSGAPAGTTTVDLTKRVNVLVIGLDMLPGRTATLTDSLMVVSLDPVGRTASILSLPRDLVGVPLGNGDTFGPKLNSLMSYADRHKAAFPEGGIAALSNAIGALLDIEIEYTARIDLVGFVKLVDALGGVDVQVTTGFSDPLYDGFGFQGKGYTISAGPHHLNGYEALAYARSRYATGESDFKRADRQQEILLAIRAKLVGSGSLLWQVPSVLDAVGDLVKTDVPVELLPTFASIADGMGEAGLTRTVLRHPLVKPGTSRYGSVQIPDLPGIRKMAAGLFSVPGVAPVPWPAPSGQAKAGASGAATP
jgi:LCP family protein required for cell wall assembly